MILSKTIQNKSTSFRSDMKVRTSLRAGQPLGDSVADFTHLTGLYHLAEFYTQVTGEDCHCKERQEWLNRLFPG